jgi:TonB family protein
VAVPRFNYELSPARKDRHVISLILHIAVLIILWRVVPLIPPPEIAASHTDVTLLYTPPPPIEQQPPAPTIKIQPPAPKVLAALMPPKLVAPEPKVEPPKIELQPKLDLAKVATPVRPKLEQKVVTGAFNTPETRKQVELKKDIVANVLGSGSSEPATVKKPAQAVQTGGFGDPNGIRGTSDKKGLVTVAALGGFNLPAGPGNGNGTGGSRGVTGTVASAGFGDVAAGGTGNRPRSGAIAQGGFGEVAAPAATAPKARNEEKSNTKPVEILSKPRPAYTDEARQLHVEGEVLVEVMFTAGGKMEVRRVVRGLGHGLDESALRAAQQIRFRPAQRNGAPYDSLALVHIVFELAQ